MKGIGVLLALGLATTLASANRGSGQLTGFIPGNTQGTAIFLFKATLVNAGAPSCNTTRRFAITSTDAKC